MIIISLEGLDKSGKATQSDLLHQKLYELGYEVQKSEFHRYDSPTGQLIRQFLDGEYQTNQLAIEAIMAADKYAQLDWLNELERNNIDVLILDRYLASQIIYGYSNGIDMDFTTNLLKYMPEPTFQFYLDIEPEESIARKGKHGDNDKYEQDKELLTRVRNNYLRYMRFEGKAGKAMTLDATLPPNELHELVLERTLSLLNEKKKNDESNESGEV